MINLSLYHDKYLCECVDVSIGKSLEGKNEFSLQMTILEMLWPYNNCYILDFGVIYQKIQNLIDRMDVLKVCFFYFTMFLDVITKFVSVTKWITKLWGHFYIVWRIDLCQPLSSWNKYFINMTSHIESVLSL